MVFALVLVLCMCYALWGAVEAILWSGKKTKAFPWNEHIVFNIQRVVFGITVILFTQVSLLIGIASLGASLPIFFFMHDGAYYKFRNMINSNVYTEKWFDESDTSSADWATMNSTWRVLLACTGVVAVVLIQFML